MKMNKAVSLIILVLIGLSCQRVTDDIQAIENDLLPTFYIEGEKPEAATLTERMKHYGVPGLSVAVYRDGDLEWAKGYGMADLESEMPVTKNTLFQAASISKPVAAVAVHKLVEEDAINLTTDINEYLSSWQLPDNEFSADEKVTFERILNHTAGTTVWGFPGYARTDTVPTAVGVVSGDGNTDPVVVYKTPGESWQYSGGGYTVMQIALEDVSGQTFEELMEQEVLEPMGMNSSTYEQPLPDSLHEYASTGYRQDSIAVEGDWHIYPEKAAAGLWTTPIDLGRYATSIQASLQGRSSALLAQGTVENMLTPGDNDHGLGPGIRYDGTHFGHGGANEGFRSDLIASMKGGNVVVIMTNSDNGSPLIAELTQAIFRHYNWSGPEPTVKQRVDLPIDHIQKFTGEYNIPEFGNITFITNDSLLVISEGEVIQEKVILVPENDSTFFDPSDGTTFQFNLSSGSPNSFVVQGFTGTRID